MVAKDALGYNIKVNGMYGYSRRSNGRVIVRTGRVMSIQGNNTVEFETIKHGTALYCRPMQYSGCKRTIVYIISNSLFPVSDGYNVGWDE